MRIEQLFGKLSSSDNIVKQEDVTISQEMMIASNGGWTCTLLQSNLSTINLLTNKIIFQLFDNNGNEIGSGNDFIVELTNSSIVIKCISPKTACNYVVIRLIAI